VFSILCSIKTIKWYYQKGEIMETLVQLGQFFVGVGLILIGSVAIWFVTIYSEKNEK
jgi:hypothetical protein